MKKKLIYVLLFFLIGYAAIGLCGIGMEIVKLLLKYNG